MIDSDPYGELGYDPPLPGGYTACALCGKLLKTCSLSSGDPMNDGQVYLCLGCGRELCEDCVEGEIDGLCQKCAPNDQDEL